MRESETQKEKDKTIQIPSLIIEEADIELDDLGQHDASASGVNNESSETNGGLKEASSDAEEKTVTLRRKANGQNNLIVEPTDIEGYKYANYIENHTHTSRKKMEIGNESMISDADLKLAATLVHDAMEGRTVDFKTEPKYVRSYNLFKSWPLTYLLYLTLIVDLSLVIFEKPGVAGLELPCYVTATIEVVCIAYFVFRTCHHAHWRGCKRFIRDMKNVFVLLITFITVMDMLSYVIVHYSHPTTFNVRFSRALRPLLIVNFSDGRQIRRAWRNIRRTINKIMHVVALFFFFILVFALIAHQLFIHNTDIVYPGGKPYFKTYSESFWDLFVLVTTSNNPDVWLPAYDNSKWYSMFFFVYILVCFYMLLNVFLAVAYHSYNENMKEEILRSVRWKKIKLGQAFDVIKINYNGEDMVTYKIWKRLMNLTKPDLSKNQVDLLMLILDMQKNGHIGRKEFMNVADLLNVPVSEVQDRTTWFESRFPHFYNSMPSEYLRAFVDSVFYKFLFDALVVIHVFLLAYFITGIEIPFFSIFLVEIFLKIYTYGPEKFFVKRLSNWFDVVITGCSLIYIILSKAVQGSKAYEIIRILKILRIFRVLRLLVHIKRFKIITDTLMNISLSIFMYGGIIFIMFYVFAIVGIEIFHDRVKFFPNETSASPMFCGAPELNGSAFHQSGYCSLNFNDFIGAMMVLSGVLFQNNWHVLADGYVAVTNELARVYFASFFMCASVIIMNIVTAFVVDMFMYEYTIQKEGKLDSAVESKIKELGLGIDAETGLEISAPLSDNQMAELIESGQIEPPPQHPWIERSTLTSFRNMENRFARFSAYVINRRSTVAPTLNRFDGIRFHIKKKGWTKIEVLLQQLYEVESDIDVTINTSQKQTRDKRLTLMN